MEIADRYPMIEFMINIIKQSKFTGAHANACTMHTEAAVKMKDTLCRGEL